jgi:hypothetical protein
MKEPSTSFDHRPDRELGAALRAALTPADPAGFVARVRAAAERRGAPTWDILARWARVGIAAAAAAAMLAGFLTGRALQSPLAPEEVAVMSAGAGATALLESPRAPDASVVFTGLVTRER